MMPVSDGKWGGSVSGGRTTSATVKGKESKEIKSKRDDIQSSVSSQQVTRSSHCWQEEFGVRVPLEAFD